MSSEIIKDETASNVADDVRSKSISIYCACVYVCVYAYSISFVERDTCSIWMHVHSYKVSKMFFIRKVKVFKVEHVWFIRLFHSRMEPF